MGATLMPAQPPAVTTQGQTSVVVATTRRLLPPFLPGGSPGKATDDPFALDEFVVPAAPHTTPASAVERAAAEPEVIPAQRLDVQVVAEHLLQVVDGAAGALRVRTPPDAEQTERGRWSQRQVLGHLIDSAANNHHRFVRAQRLDSFTFPAYDQEAWVEVQHYMEADWEELVGLWWLYNRHIARVIRHLPADRLEVACTIGSDQPVTLAFLVADYVSHLEHHLRQLGVG